MGNHTQADETFVSGKRKNKHAKTELALFKKRKKMEGMGVKYNEEVLAAGEYDDILIDG